MPTVTVNLDPAQYVQINTGYSPMLLQSQRDDVRIVFSTAKPIKLNTVYHTLGADNEFLPIMSLDTNVWALATTTDCSLIVSQTVPFPTDSFMNDVARGRIPGATPFGSYGKRTASAGETNQVLWPDGSFKIPPSGGIQMRFVSTAAADSAAGTNIQQIEMHYIDGAGAEASEIITLQGLTPVDSTATDVAFINCIHVHTFGTSPYAAGTITAKDTSSTDTYSIISTGDLRCSSSARMVPVGKVCMVKGAIGGAVSGTAAAGVVMQIVATELDANQYIDPMILFPHGGIGLQDVSIGYNFPIPLKFSAGSVIALSESTDKAAIITGSWFGWLENA